LLSQYWCESAGIDWPAQSAVRAQVFEVALAAAVVVVLVVVVVVVVVVVLLVVVAFDVVVDCEDVLREMKRPKSVTWAKARSCGSFELT